MSNEDKFRQDYYRYGAGFVGALLLTYGIYFLATTQALDGMWLAATLLVLASLQVGLQLVVFLHILKEKQPNWIIRSIIYSLVTLFIVVAGSLWIMTNLNYNMHMSPEQMEQYMLEQNKKGF